MARGVDFILKTGVDAIEEKEYELTARLISGIRQYDNITIWGPQTAKNRAAVLSITIDGYEPQDISIYLDQIFDIAVRTRMRHSGHWIRAEPCASVRGILRQKKR